MCKPPLGRPTNHLPPLSQQCGDTSVLCPTGFLDEDFHSVVYSSSADSIIASAESGKQGDIREALVRGKQKGAFSKYGCYYPWPTLLACITDAATRLELPMKEQLTKWVLHYHPNTVCRVGNLPEHTDKVRSRSLLLPPPLSLSLSLSLRSKCWMMWK